MIFSVRAALTPRFGEKTTGQAAMPAGTNGARR